MRLWIAACPALLAALVASPAPAASGGDGPASTLADDATAFGTLPSTWGVELSPSGEQISSLQMHQTGVPIGTVLSLTTGKANLIAASDKDRFDLTWCRWASEERLLCGYSGVDRDGGVLFYTTRLIGVDADGSDVKVLLQRKLEDEFAQFQDRVIDYMPDDPDRVMVVVPDGAGSRVDELDIRTGHLAKQSRARANARDWMTDGTGRLRIRQLMDKKGLEWQFRRSTGNSWHRLRESRYEDGVPVFTPIGFGEGADELLVFETHQGRIALLSIDLAADEPKDRLVYGRPDVDLAAGLQLGRQQRLVGVLYATDTLHTHYFDQAVGKIIEAVGAALPDQAIDVLGESWDRRFYLIRASNDRDPGTYFRFDVEKRELLRLFTAQPLLANRQLATMRPIRHPAADGEEIPAYLTLPVEPAAGPLPVVILPHGGPQSRDIWGFDWLAQFFAARGYAVLQSNFRGSGGFGADWAGDGGFKKWRLVVSDLEQGAQWLIDQGIADPERMCIVGWSYGGYAALMSALEHPSRYRCVVSIAGVTDPGQLIHDNRRFIGGKMVDEFVGRSAEVLKQGSATRRAGELTAPVLLLHGDEDINVPIQHSRSLARALRNEKKPVELIEFDDAEHSIWSTRDRVELLERIGAFLDLHTRPTAPKQARAGVED